MARPLTLCYIDLQYWSHVGGDRSQGIYPEILVPMMAEAGVNDYRLLPVPYARLTRMMRSGECDMSFSVAPSDTPSVRLGHEYWQLPVGFAHRSELAITHLHELSDYRVGMLRGTDLAVELPEEVLGRAVYSRFYANLVKMMAAGRLDAVFGDLGQIMRAAEWLDYQGIETVTLRATGLHFIAHERSPHFYRFEDINALIRHRAEDGSFDRAVRKHIKVQFERDQQ